RQLRSVPKGDTLEEDHARDRHMIVNYIIDKTGAIEQTKRGGKTFVQVKDYQKMRQGVGLLLAELMRIKAEGDYAAIKALVDKYGVHFDPKLRDQVVARSEERRVGKAGRTRCVPYLHKTRHTVSARGWNRE